MFARAYYCWLWTESAVTRVVFLKLYYLFSDNTELLWSMTMLSPMTWLMMMVVLIGSRWIHRIHTLMSSCHGNQMWNDVGHRFGPTHWVLIGQIVVIWQISELWLVRLLSYDKSLSCDWSDCWRWWWVTAKTENCQKILETSTDTSLSSPGQQSSYWDDELFLSLHQPLEWMMQQTFHQPNILN